MIILKDLKKKIHFELELDYKAEELKDALDYLKQSEPYNVVLENLINVIEEVLND